ncbi:hypothetical protein PHLGIDRAFT_12311 [Phlebiopsis gigantea 11061_1 CR5-6]|uniref:F-box domain-containing protein n=1 Tax=Phlebiopsis gigantea (strain 11061_1 CR5-6) TaxID=745531 RepID=A0A0C3SCI3_PHLG1|nr:hypothetical protein PHLGIDRAFT_12311 [Phlebiopsis gigantea 11061_1 CR5-6]
MHLELGTYDLFVLVSLCLGYLLRVYYDYATVPRSYQDDGPRSPFDEETVKEKTEETAEEQRLSPAASSLASPPTSSQEHAVDSVGSTSPAPPSTVSSRPGSPASVVSVPDSDASQEDAGGLFVSRILTNDLLYDLVLRPADPCTLVRLSHTCRGAHAAVRSHVARTFNINAHLGRYFSDPLAFRALQAATGTLISGSSALQFLDRTFYPEADLDLYCFYDARAEVGLWLMRQGYRFAPNSRQDPSFRVAVAQARVPGTDVAAGPYSRMKAVSAVYTFVKRVESLDGPSTRLKVQIIVAYNNPMEAIFHFHSTAVLNVISYSHAYALYPRATFLDRVSLSLLPRSVLDDAVEAKYSQRGWRFLHALPPPPLPDVVNPATGRVLMRYTRLSECEHCAHCVRRRAEERSITRAFPAGPRWIGDGHSWVVPLDVAGLVDRKPRRGETGKKIQARVVTGDGFWYAYVVSDDKLRRAMATVQELYHHIPGAPDERYCDGEFVQWCETMLEGEKRWDTWYPPVPV